MKAGGRTLAVLTQGGSDATSTADATHWTPQQWTEFLGSRHTPYSVSVYLQEGQGYKSSYI